MSERSIYFPKPSEQHAPINKLSPVEFILDTDSVPEVLIDGESVPVVSCSYQYITCGLGEGVNLITATVLIGYNHALSESVQLVVYHNNLTGETYFQ